ncbi:nucleotidyltransferase [Parvibaculum sp.]|uniref:nucleotidyltransferase domain-containing protein n=1 Tax=Parvibaculum sp. TaxID=2024848 RepID=UPI00262AE685|nr:nucleotidyltransferase [Parvibaculum sp.]MCW5726246.1 nucleotidyltransferase [Parvibaculum sp.]
MNPVDVMLADIAVRIQLTPTDYQTAVNHYEAIHEWLERENSPLCGLIEEFYPQGGFSIGATVARHSTDDEFDIDVMVQLAYRPDVDPEFVLSTLDQAIRSERGSRYHGKADRKTRCSTVYYAGMHLDVTPTVRLAGTIAKTGYIFHSKPEDPREPKLSLFANPYGFAQWFNGQTPPDGDFSAFFEKRSLDYERGRLALMEKADATPVPDQAPAYRKSRAVIALQLIKRWRNLTYDRRHEGLRLPPSVLLAYYVAIHANQTTSLSGELMHQVECMLATLEAAERDNATVAASNPMCPEDELTDRWPANLEEQHVFIEELRGLTAKLRRLREEIDLSETQEILEELFGERPAQTAIKEYIERVAGDVGGDGGRYLPGKAAISAGLAGSSATPSSARVAPPHKFFGDEVK